MCLRARLLSLVAGSSYGADLNPDHLLETILQSILLNRRLTSTPSESLGGLDPDGPGVSSSPLVTVEMLDLRPGMFTVVRSSSIIGVNQ